jgi:hypothetical protein
MWLYVKWSEKARGYRREARRRIRGHWIILYLPLDPGHFASCTYFPAFALYYL